MVVYAEHEDGADYASRVIEDLASHHPSRALIVVARPSDDESHIEAQLAAHCHISRALEQSRLLRRDHAERGGPRPRRTCTASSCRCWCPTCPSTSGGPSPCPRGRHLFQELMESADRFIVDSFRFRHPTHGLLRVAELCVETPGCAVGDINWARMRPWREALLRHGGEPGMRAYRDAATAVEIAYSDGEEGRLPSQVFLLIGWLAERLGWDASAPQVEDGRRVVLRRDGQPITIRLEAREARPDHGSILRVRLEDEQGASLSIVRPDDPLHLEVEVRTPDYDHRERIRLDPPEAGEMLAAELDDLPGQSSEYEQVLQRALPLVRALDVGH